MNPLSVRDYQLGWTLPDLLKRLGLYTQHVDLHKNPAYIARAATDSVSGTLAAWHSKAEIDPDTNELSVVSHYWRHIPGLASRSITPFRSVYTQTLQNGSFVWTPKEIWVQAKQIFPAPDNDFVVQAVMRVQDMQAQINTHLRGKGAVDDTLKIITNAGFQKFLGEEFILKGLKKEGGFHPSATAAQIGASNPAADYPFLENLDPQIILALLGLDVNTVDPGKDYVGSRSIPALSHGTEVEHEARADFSMNDKTGDISLTISSVPLGLDDQEGREAVQVASMTLAPEGLEGYRIAKPTYMGQLISAKHWRDVMNLFGIVQSAGDDFSNYRYPDFLSHIGEFDLVKLLSPLGPAPSLTDQGGEFLAGSFHGTSFEKLVDDFGNQIGICQLFLHRGTKPDGQTSIVGVLIDLPIAIGGKGASFDRAIANLEIFWPYIKQIKITHDHFDHLAGVIDLAELGWMKGKIVSGSPDLIHTLRRQLSERQIPRSLWPMLESDIGTGFIEVLDDDDVLRFCIQHCEGGTLHTAKTTPYIVSAWYGHNHFKGSAVVYGDGFDFSEQGKAFMKRGLQPLIEAGYPEHHCIRPITVAYHDCTAVSEVGETPKQDEVAETLDVVFSWFDDKGIIASPLSTNILDIKNLITSACAHHRNITAVGSNIEKRLTNMNNYGVDPHYGPIPDKKFVPDFIEKTIAELENGADIRFLRRETDEAKELRDDPQSLLIIATGAFGGRDEYQSTMQRFLQGTSLLDANMSVRPTGYKINAEDYVYINLQTPSVPEKADDQYFQNQMIAYNRAMPVVNAFTRGFELQNLEPARYDRIVQDLQRRGWRYHAQSGNRRITVYDRPIHRHGHPFRENLAQMASHITADFHEPIHIASVDTFVAFQDLMRSLNLNSSGQTPRLFKLSRIDTYKTSPQDRFVPKVQLHESLKLIRQHRRRDRGYGGSLDVRDVTIFRADAQNPIDGFMPRSSGQMSVFFKSHATRPWAELHNPRNADGTYKIHKAGPAASHRAPSDRRRRQGRPTLGTPLPSLRPLEAA